MGIIFFRVIPPLFENKFFSYIPRNRIIANTFKIKDSSRSESLLSSYSLAPFLFINPMEENDEIRNENTASTKLCFENSDFPSQNSLLKREFEKGKLMQCTFKLFIF